MNCVRKPLVTALAAALFAVACGRHNTPHERSIEIYAAASLSSALLALREPFRQRAPNIELSFNFAASSLLARQIEQGASADLFISAHPMWTEYLQDRDLLAPENAKAFLSNRLVLIVPKHASARVNNLQDLASARVTRIALGDWTHVPVGLYARQALERLGLWASIVHKCIAAVDARAAVTYVAQGQADCGIVYRSDAHLSSEVEIAAALPEAAQPEIRYIVAWLRHAGEAQRFLAFLTSPEARPIFERYGFTILNGADGDHGS